jgi:hypothetical protein
MNQIVADLIRQLSNTVLIGSIAVCTVGYATSCMYIYYRAPRLVALTAAVCITLVLLESLWNGLRITPVERLAVVMPMAINVGLTWSLHRQKSNHPTSAVPAAYFAV